MEGEAAGAAKEHQHYSEEAEAAKQRLLAGEAALQEQLATEKRALETEHESLLRSQTSLQQTAAAAASFREASEGRERAQRERRVAALARRLFLGKSSAAAFRTWTANARLLAAQSAT